MPRGRGLGEKKREMKEGRRRETIRGDAKNLAREKGRSARQYRGTRRQKRGHGFTRSSKQSTAEGRAFKRRRGRLLPRRIAREEGLKKKIPKKETSIRTERKSRSGRD